MRRVKSSVACGLSLFLLVMMVSMAEAGGLRESSTEMDTDRMGMDYRNFDLHAADPRLCRDACDADQRCKAWTYVKPNTIQGPNPRCWLKGEVPQPATRTCCVSGVKRR